MGKKLSIAICDDSADDRRTVVSYLADYMDSRGYVATVTEFASGDALLSRCAEGYDLLILDIIMLGINGIETAQALLEKTHSTQIIFCSSSNAYAAESYDVNAMRYLTKPLSREKFFQTLDRFFTSYTTMRMLEYRANRMDEHILLSNVLWIEADDHRSLIHTKSGIIPTTTTLTQFSQQLADADFVKPIRYALVSLAAVVAVPTDSFLLADGTKIPIGRGLREEMKKAFFAYKTCCLLYKQQNYLSSM